VVQPSINANVFYNNELRIHWRCQRSQSYCSVQWQPAEHSCRPDGERYPNRFLHGFPTMEYTSFGLPPINYDNWTMQLNGATLNTYNIGTVASNGISTTVPAGNFVYFENVAPSVFCLPASPA
jgi:hypothetical protein